MYHERKVLDALIQSDKLIKQWRSHANHLRSEHEKRKLSWKDWPEPSCYQSSADVLDGCASELEKSMLSI